MAKQTRRVQVFIGEQASVDLDDIAEAVGCGQTKAIESALAHYAGVVRVWVASSMLDPAQESGLVGLNPTERLTHGLARQPTSLRIDQSHLDEIAQESERNSLSPEAAQKRAEKKAARGERKAGLAASVGASLAGLAAESATDQAERMKREAPGTANASDLVEKRTYCPFHRPKFCEADCKHRVSA